MHFGHQDLADRPSQKQTPKKARSP